MGIFHSKVDVAAIEAIEFSVSALIIRLGEEEVKIDDYVKHKISNALSVYSNIIKKEKKKGYISKRKMENMKNLISQARSKLEHLPSAPRTYENREGKPLYQMKTELFDIEKRLNNNRIKEDEYECFFHVVTTYSKNLEFNCKTSLTQEQEDNVSVLVLRLFLKTPAVKTSNVLQYALCKLQEATEHFGMFGTNSVTVFNAEEVEKNLEEIKGKIETISEGVKKLDQEVKTKGVNVMKEDSHRSCTYASKLLNRSFKPSWIHKEEPLDGVEISRHEHLLKQVESDLSEYGTVVDKFCSPIGGAAVDNVKQKVSNLLNTNLKKVPSEGELRIRKKALFDKGMQIVERLNRINEENKEIRENLKNLVEIERELSTTLESNLSFQEKQNRLEKLVEMVKQINTNNSEVVLQKTGTVNKIEGSLIVESMFYLRKLMKTVDNCRMYAQQFAFPRSIDLYKIKTEEVHSLRKYLDDVPKGNKSVDKRIQHLLEQINEVLEVFDFQVKNNDEIIASLKYLENIAIEVNYRDQHLDSRLIKLQSFNDSRKRIESVNGVNHRVLNKKMEIRRNLHVLEEKSYLMEYPREIQEVKMVLNEHEKSAQQWVHPTSSEQFNQKESEIVDLWKESEVMMHEKRLSYDHINVIKENFKLVIKLLDKAGKEKKTSSDRIQSAEIIKNKSLNIANTDMSISRKLELLEGNEGLIKVMRKTSSVCKVDVSTVFENTEKIITTEKSKLQLSQMHPILAKFAEEITHPMDTDFFKYKLNEILHLKEHVEDMPEGNPELDSLKQSFVQEIFINLRKLDEFVASLVKNRKQSENILNLKNHFSEFNLDNMDIKRESVEFVQMVRQRAESFSDLVKFYLGTNYSVDYYVIHENLMRLLLELDRLSCEDPVLLNAIVDTVGYIKNLIEQLDSNASSE